MEIRDYEIPTSWNDKGMDWDNPDLTSVDYIMALKEAIIERYNIHGVFISSTLKYYLAPLYEITPYSPFDVDKLDAIIYSLSGLNKVFIDNMEDCQSLVISDLWAEEDCGTFNADIYRGEADLQALVPWFKAIKNIINKLTLLTSVRIYFRSRVQRGSTERYPDEKVWNDELNRYVLQYGEDAQAAVDNALSNLYFSTDTKGYLTISYFSASCIVEEVSNRYTVVSGSPVRNNGYDATVSSTEFSTDGTFRMHTNASCNLIFRYTASASGSYYDYYYWQNPATMPPEVVYCKDGLIPEFQIGDVNDFPYSGQSPPATQDLCVRYYYTIETFADFGISDGFKFQ